MNNETKEYITKESIQNEARHPTFNDPYLQHYWESRGIYSYGIDYRLVQCGENVEQIEKDTFEF